MENKELRLKFQEIFNLIRVNFSKDSTRFFTPKNIEYERAQIINQLKEIMPNREQYKEVVNLFLEKRNKARENSNIKSGEEVLKFTKSLIIEAADDNNIRREGGKTFKDEQSNNNSIQSTQLGDVFLAINFGDFTPDTSVMRGQFNEVGMNEENQKNLDEIKVVVDMITVFRDEGILTPRYSKAHDQDMCSFKNEVKESKLKKDKVEYSKFIEKQYTDTTNWIGNELKPNPTLDSSYSKAILKFYKENNVMPNEYRQNDTGEYVNKLGKVVKNKNDALVKDNTNDLFMLAIMAENGFDNGVTNDRGMANATPKFNEANRLINKMSIEEKVRLGLPLFDLSDKMNMMHTSEFKEKFESQYEEMKERRNNKDNQRENEINDKLEGNDIGKQNNKQQGQVQQNPIQQQNNEQLGLSKVRVKSSDHTPLLVF
jgi:hypothetical protein